MKRLNVKTLKHGKEIREVTDNAILREIRERNKVVNRKAKEASVTYKNQLEQRKCVQSLYFLEKNYDFLIEKGINDVEIMEQEKMKICKELENAAVKSMGRILAEIKTQCLNLKEMIEVEISFKDFFENFEQFYQSNYSEYNLTKQEFDKIIKPYIDTNLKRIRSLGERFLFLKPANKLESNIVYLKNTLIKEANLQI